MDGMELSFCTKKNYVLRYIYMIKITLQKVQKVINEYQNCFIIRNVHKKRTCFWLVYHAEILIEDETEKLDQFYSRTLELLISKYWWLMVTLITLLKMCNYLCYQWR